MSNPTPAPRVPSSLRYEAGVLRAILATIAPFVLVVWLRYHGLPWPLPAGLHLSDLGWLATAALLAWGASAVEERPREGRWIATTGLLLGSGLLIADLWTRPQAAYVLLITAALLLSRIWPRAWLPARYAGPATAEELRAGAAWDARAAAWVAIGAWSVSVPTEWTARRSSAAALALVVAVALLFGLRWARADRALGGRRWIWVAVGALAGWSAALAQWRISPLVATVPLLIVPIATSFAANPRQERPAPQADDLAAVVLDRPARSLIAVFSILGLWGGAVLALPVCAAQPGRLSFLDALFTAVSGVTGAGLAVLPSGALSFVGHLTLLAFIQAGGLVILGFAASAANRIGQLELSVQRVLALALAIEAGGAVSLAYLFRMAGDPLDLAIWNAIFLSVSAFCNAGFTLANGSLAERIDQPLVLGTVGLLALAGALGPAVLAAIPGWIRTRRASVSTRLAVLSAALLLVVPAALLTLFEADHALAGASFTGLVSNALFLSASSRSAGFTTFDLAQLQPASVALLMALMFVGGAPGSTAGGVKTSTLALLGLAVWATIRGDEAPSAFGRRFPASTIYRAAAIATVACFVVSAALTTLLATQEVAFEQALFEVLSALGGVGFSLGATAHLDEIGKVVLILCMLVGRVGPLTMFLLLSGPRREGRVGLPEQDLPVG